MNDNIESPQKKFDLLSFVKRYEVPISLTILIALYLLLSNFFAWSQAFANLFFNTSGGSDPYFNYYIIQYILNYKVQLLHTIALNYPLGSGNPRPPFFHWMIVFIAVVLSPILGLNNAAYFAFNEFDAVFGALLIIPVYLIAKEAFGKKTGIVAAFLYTLMPGNLSAGIITDGRMHTPELLFAFLAIYFFERAIKLSKKNLILDRIFGVKDYPSSIYRFYSENKLASIYALMAGASIGGLMLSWQGYTYIEVIILIYVAVQGTFNLLMRRPSGYLTYYTTIAMLFGFLLGFYYYYGSGLIITWYVPSLVMAVMVIAFMLLINIIGRKSWVITVPLTIFVSLAGFFILSKIDPAVVNDLISGEGYFIKTRVYTTIAEAAPLPLGEYINSFGVGQFIIGMSGLVYVVYKYIKQKTDIMLFILVFSIISIFMSFEAARFNITAAPAYAVLGGALLLYFADMVRLSDIKKRNRNVSGVKKSIKGGISGVHATFVVIIVLALVLPAGIGMINSAVPANSASVVNDAIYHELPSFLRPNNTSGADYFGASGFYIDNNTQPLAESFAWLSKQNTNVPIDERPAYVSWWDYGFQELYQGQHPTVADDFQQGYVPAGQILLAQNESQIVSVFIARIVKGYLHNTANFNVINQTLVEYLGVAGAKNVYEDYFDPAKFTSTVTGNASTYGSFISSPTADNVYYGYLRGYLSSNYPMSTITDLYTALESVTGYDIQYVQIDHGLFPESGLDPGIFYAPAYLTDMKTYTYDGEIVPYTYYQIYANTTSGVYPLNQLPSDLTPTSYYITYNPSFYNTSIYRFMVGYPPSAVGESGGVPGITYGSSQDEVMPGWNMSNFEISYLGVPYNPYKNYSAHPDAWTTIPIQTAYTYEKENKGTVILLPTLGEIFDGADPIMSYYPGANIEGRVTMANGQPVGGVYLTIYDQYGIPHQVVQTSANGYYNLTALPGNDTVLISTGTLNPLTLMGSNYIGNGTFYVTQAEAERIPTTYNSTTGLPDYDFQFNYQLGNSSISGRVGYEYNYPHKSPTEVYANSGTLILTNSTYNSTVTLPLVNGYYTDNTIQPYSYEASLILNGTTYTDVQKLNVSVGGSFVYDIYVNYNQIFANVTISGHNVDGFSLDAYGNGRTYQGKEINSSYVIYVPEGTFKIVGTYDGSTTYPAYVTFNAYGQNTTLNLSAYESVNVTGYVPVKSGNVQFYMDGQDSMAFSANISAGRYSINLISGVYTVYFSNGKTAFMKTYNIYRNENISFTPVSGYYLNLSSYLPNQELYAGLYTIVNDSIDYEYAYSSNTSMSIFLPGGVYYVSSSSSIAGIDYSVVKTISLVANYGTDLKLLSGKSVAFLVYNGNLAPGFSASSEVNNGIVTLYSNGYPVTFSNISANGEAIMNYPNSTTNRSAVVESAFFVNKSVSASSTTVNVGLSPVYVDSNITLTYNGNKISNSGIVTFYGHYNYSLPLINGSVSGKMLPGVYLLSINNDTNEIVYGNTSVSVNGMHHDIPVYIYAYLNVTVPNTEIIAKSGEPVPSGLLPIGNYTIYSASGYNVSIAHLVLKTNYNLSSVSLSPGYKVNISNSLGLSGTYRIISPDFVMNISNGGEGILPAGSYRITFTASGSSNYNSYYANGSINVTVSSNENITVPVSITDVTTSLYVSTGQAASMVYLYRNGTVFAMAESKINGTASFEVPTGDYSVYAISSDDLSAYAGYLTIPAFTEEMHYNASLTSAYRTNLMVAIGNKPMNMNVNVSLGNFLMTVNSSVKEIYLPIGNYTFESTLVSTISYNTFTTWMNYSVENTVYVHGTSYVSLYLQRESIYAFKFSSNTTVQKIIAENENGIYSYEPVTYNFTLENVGNMPVNITLSSKDSNNWNITFKNETIHNLIPGKEINDTAVITAKRVMPAGSNAVPIAVNYSNGVNDENLYVMFPSISDINISSLPSASNRTNLEIPVVLNNTGNTNITVGLSISNKTISNLFYYGYNVSYPAGVTVPYNTSEIVNVTLIPITSKPYSTVSFMLNITYDSTVKNITLTGSYPQLSKVNIVVNGTGIISNYTANPYMSLYIGLILIAVTVVAGLILIAYRGRKKK